jgi:hypothetical protein
MKKALSLPIRVQRTGLYPSFHRVFLMRQLTRSDRPSQPELTDRTLAVTGIWLASPLSHHGTRTAED